MVNVELIQTLLSEYFIINDPVKIDPVSGQVDVDGNVRLIKKIDQLPVSFGVVKGDFDCSHKGLTTLQGAPRIVEDSFWCQDNKLTSLEGAPQSVHDFYVDHNRLTSLKHAPQIVGNSFGCSNNLLQSLDGCPQHIPFLFFCDNNKLTDLRGGPKTVGYDYVCSDNRLTSLAGAPQTVAHAFTCSWDQNLPLLPLLAYPSVTLVKAPVIVKKIIKKYLGQGRKGVLKCAAELGRAGYKANARW